MLLCEPKPNNPNNEAQKNYCHFVTSYNSHAVNKMDLFCSYSAHSCYNFCLQCSMTLTFDFA